MTIEINEPDALNVRNWIYEHLPGMVDEMRSLPFSKVQAIASKKSDGDEVQLTGVELLQVVAAHSMMPGGVWVGSNRYEYEHPQNKKNDGTKIS